MKSAVILVFTFLLSALICQADDKEKKELKAGVYFEEEKSQLTIVYGADPFKSFHSVIELNRMDDLSYKTRVMRYFGGILVSQQLTFDKIVVVDDRGVREYLFNRANMSSVVKEMYE